MNRSLAIAALAAALAATAPARAADDLATAVQAIQRKAYDDAVRLLLPLAQGGDARAQARLAALYYHGHGVAESDADAFVWYRRAAVQGVAEAQYQLANMYAFGLGVPADDEADADRHAAQWYFVAARQGHREAQYGLAVLFLTGKGVVRSDEEALRWMRKAAAAGHADARAYVRGRSARR